MGKNNTTVKKAPSKPVAKPETKPAPRAITKPVAKPGPVTNSKPAVKKPKMFDRLNTKPTVDRDAQRREFLDRDISRKDPPAQGLILNRKKEVNRYGLPDLKGGI